MCMLGLNLGAIMILLNTLLESSVKVITTEQAVHITQY